MRNWGLSITTALAALLLLAPVSFAKKAIGDIDQPTSLSAKYRLTDGGYLVFAVDDSGRAEGYYYRAGRFGQLFGTVSDGVLDGYWAEADGETKCKTAKRGMASWGRVELNFEEPGEFRGAIGVCEREPAELIGGRQ